MKLIGYHKTLCAVEDWQFGTKSIFKVAKTNMFYMLNSDVIVRRVQRVNPLNAVYNDPLNAAYDDVRMGVYAEVIAD